MEFLKVWYRNNDDRYSWVLAQSVTVNVKDEKVVYGLYRLDNGEWFEISADYVNIEYCKVDVTSFDK